jgi:hypothetical protein
MRPQDLAVLNAMKADRFDVAGSTRTYWDFYFGFGLAISGYLALQATVLWQIAPLVKNAALPIRPIVAAFFMAFVANAVVVSMYFFLIPLVFAIAIVLCLALAFGAVCWRNRGRKQRVGTVRPALAAPLPRQAAIVG